MRLSTSTAEMWCAFSVSQIAGMPFKRRVSLRSTTRRVAATSCASSPSAKRQKATIAAVPDSAEEDLGVSDAILKAEKKMSDLLGELSFGSPVTHVYDPLKYAWDAHEWYVRRYGNRRRKYVLVGMNPGPWGMAQTGVPFGQVEAVRDFLKMPEDIAIGKPEKENKQRLVEGLGCKRSEVSGKRLWLEWIRAEYGTADAFFDDFYVHNYCPVMLMEGSGKNRTPVQLKKKERDGLTAVCDGGLRDVIAALQADVVIGIGAFAEDRCKVVLEEQLEAGCVIVERLLHPSPASPASVNWAVKATARIREIIEGAERRKDDGNAE